MEMLKIRLFSKAAFIRLGLLSLILMFFLIATYSTLIAMPGASYQGAIPPLTNAERSLKAALQQEVEMLATTIGNRDSTHYQNLNQAANFLEASLQKIGYDVKRQAYPIGGQPYYNLEVEITGNSKADEIIIIGGHYDSVFDSPGANDNGTGAAATLELARHFFGEKPERTLRFVEFVNEEPPFFWTEEMGSLIYAKRCRERHEKVVAMLSLETMGYYSEIENSQKYPSPLNWLYPSSGNFIAFVGNIPSRNLVRETIASFRHHVKFPSEGAAIPNWLPGVGWSDHWSFWQQGYPAIMVTDTATFRYPYYHTQQDSPDKIDYEKTAKVVAGMEVIISDLAGMVLPNL